MIHKTCQNPNCKKQFTADRYATKYCSQSCAATVNNTGVRRHGKDPGTCKWCGGPKKLSRSKYCSTACAQAYKAHNKVDAWLSGNWSGSQPSGGLSTTIREHLLNKTKHTCSRCGWSEIHLQLGYAPVQVDHKNGNWKDNRPTNLRVLCPNCHSLTENFGALNKTGNGRRLTGGSVGSRN